MLSSRSSLKPYFLWLLPVSFFAYQFILRLWPSLMMQQTMERFQIDATSFGFLASIYYYGYAGMQIPLSLLLDRYGARRVVFLCAVLCGLATWVFTTTSSLFFAFISRFLVGAGSAVGFLGVSQVVSQWFPKEQYGRMIGFSFSLGLLGAIYGGKPVSLWVEKMGWQPVAYGLVGVSFGLGAAIYLFLKTPPQEGRSAQSLEKKVFSFSDLKKILSSPWLWGLALSNLLMVGSLEGFADVWGVNYLMTAHGFSKADAAELISFIFVGMLVGGPLLAWISQKMGTYEVIALAGVGMALAFFFLLFAKGGWSWVGLAALFGGVGILCCYQVLVFAAGCEGVSPSLLGITVGFLNCVNMLGGSFFHTLIGYTMDVCWVGQVTDTGVRLYTLSSYTWALTVIPVCALVGVCLLLKVKKSQKEGCV